MRQQINVLRRTAPKGLSFSVFDHDDVHWVRYIVEENGEQKQYETRMKEKGGNDPSYFVKAMAAVEPGEVITLEMKKVGIKNYVEILRPSTGEVQNADIGDDDEPEDDGTIHI